jgi:hypothetical protein
LVELYDIYDDPEEMNNLLKSELVLANKLYDELMTKMQTADAPYSS